MRVARWALGLAMLAAPPSAQAQPAPAPPARAAAERAEPRAGSAPVWVWYRTSEGCPDGEAFVSRLSELGKTARLASVGDRVDFVVTLGSGPQQSSGRLERQTRGGTVAIREYRDARCEQVAEALALTLDLALEPEPVGGDAAPAQTPGRVGAAAPELPPGVEAAPTASTTAGTTPASAIPASDAPRALATPAAPSKAPGELALGAQATLVTGVAPGALPGGALFLAGRTSSAWLTSWRGTLFAAYRESSSREREIDVLVAGARVEGCSFEARAGALAVSPCLGLDVGLLRASGPAALGTTDTGSWSALAAHGRAEAALAPRLSLELQVGGILPLVRYEMGTRDGSAEWFRTRAVGLDARLGAAWRFP